MYKSSGFSLLLGEDERYDALIIEKILKQMDYNGHYQHLPLGQDVIDWTLKRGQYKGADHPQPSLIIVDIGLPGITGIEVLETLRNEEASRHIPIIMCSGSSSQRDFHRCIAHGCNAYVQKNAELDKFFRTIQLFIEGWFHLSKQDFF